MKEQQTISDILRFALRALEAARDAKAAEAVWREYAGRRGLLRERLRRIGKLPHDARFREGRAVHEALARFQAKAEECLARLKQKEEEFLLRRDRIDVTLPAPSFRRGSLHPLTIVRRRAERIFASLGFSVVEGPEVEDVQHNFDALNIPEDHPARDLWDTFWIKAQKKAEDNAEGRRKLPRKSASDLRQSAAKQALLLRTHTSPVQIRYMERNQPPFRIIVPGEVYRYEATDASHESQFMQLEGLMVDYRSAKSPVTMSTLLSVLSLFFRQFFQKPVALRFRPSYFPFVEPGIEVDVSCIVCSGTGRVSQSLTKGLSGEGEGCLVCRQSGWVEMLGAGMVHPKVFEAVRYNPKQAQGFAFGFGIDRLAMLKYRIPDIRLFRRGDIRFLRQFR